MHKTCKKFAPVGKLYFVKGGLYDVKKYGVWVSVGKYDNYCAAEFDTKDERKWYIEEQKRSYDQKPKFAKYIGYENTLVGECISVKG